MSFLTKDTDRAFTIVELVVSVAIFAFMTAFLVAKYGNFNQSVLLTNLAYDVALTIRNAQTYGLNVKSKPSGVVGYTDGTTYDEIAAGYQYGYGIHFEAGNATAASKKMIFFADNTPNAIPSYDNAAKVILSTYTLRNGSYISAICAQARENPPGEPCLSSSSPNGGFDVVFKRPDPDAMFPLTNGATVVTLTISTPNGQSKKVIVRKSGQVAVLQN
jgi:Tfp pilus assembly protein FimT